MGHIRLGVLPKYPKWKNVISLLENEDVPAAQVAERVLDGSKRTLDSESAQASVSYCVWLIAQLALASRGDDFRADLSRLGIQTSEETNATEFLAKVSRTASRHLASLAPHTMVNNLAGLALRETLARSIGVQSSTLFGARLDDVQRALRHYSTSTQFSSLLHSYFTDFLTRTLRFVIDKEIANQLGPGERFASVKELQDFEATLEGFAGQTSRIVDEFSGGWYSKRAWQQGAISASDAEGFVHVALDKLKADLDLNEA
jgi:hypothetical protein